MLFYFYNYIAKLYTGLNWYHLTRENEIKRKFNATIN